MSAHDLEPQPTDGPEYHAEHAAWRARQPVYGMCTACGSVEVALDNVTGRRDLSAMGESPSYPIGYGCEVCS